MRTANGVMVSDIRGLPTLGVDLGGTKVETSLVDADGGIVSSHRRPTDAAKGPGAVIADIVACVQDCLGEAGGNARALGIGVAGQVDKTTGVVRYAPNLGWRDEPLRTKLERALGLPVVVTNDVRAATWGEWKHGAGQGVDDLVCLFVGTGVGGGIVASGHLLEGCTNTAGELGHLTIVRGGRKCHCPNWGCLEAYTGGWAISERSREAVDADPEAGRRLASLADKDGRIPAAAVARARGDGDALAGRLIEETAAYLAAGVVSIVNAFNPCLFILGGGVIQGLPDLVPMVDEAARASALEAAALKLRIVTAALGDKAGVVGAAAVARHETG